MTCKKERITSKADLKSSQRLQAQKGRRQFVESLTPEQKEAHAQKQCDLFWQTFAPSAPSKVALYWPLAEEADTRPLLLSLVDRGHLVALPKAHQEGPLTFHIWHPDKPLTRGSFHVQEPQQGQEIEAKLLTHLIIPLLAFDATGQRMGYGQGHYDRTLSQLRRGEGSKAPLCIGYAYACQERDVLPSEPHDQPLEALITEKKVFHFCEGK